MKLVNFNHYGRNQKSNYNKCNLNKTLGLNIPLSYILSYLKWIGVREAFIGKLKIGGRRVVTILKANKSIWMIFGNGRGAGLICLIEFVQRDEGGEENHKREERTNTHTKRTTK